MWPEADGTVLVAVYHRRAVVRVDTAGRITEVVRTPAGWGPSGILRAPDGTLWVLEYSTKNEARVRRAPRRAGR